MKHLQTEALWALQQLHHSKKIRTEDSAILFVSWNILDTYLEHLKSAWHHPQATHTVAIKTQPHIDILKHIVQMGFGLEAATWEEVKLARMAGCPSEKIVFDSPVKRPSEIQDCAEHSPGMLLNANSLQELDRMAPYHSKIRMGLRINPLVDVNAPAVYNVSQIDSKFGVPLSQKEAILIALKKYPISTLHIHVGSSLSNFEGAVSAVHQIVALAEETNKYLKSINDDRRITHIDIGGGLLPENLEETTLSSMQTYVHKIKNKVPQLWTDYQLITEFGQWTHFYSGYAYSDVEYVVHKEGQQMAYIHLGADFLLRDVYVQPRPIQWIPIRQFDRLEGKSLNTDMAGPLCFAGDFPVKNIKLPSLNEGDGMLLCGTGSNAYGLWSRHTSRTIPAFYGVDYKNKNVHLLSDRFNPFLWPS